MSYLDHRFARTPSKLTISRGKHSWARLRANAAHYCFILITLECVEKRYQVQCLLFHSNWSGRSGISTPNNSILKIPLPFFHFRFLRHVTKMTHYKIWRVEIPLQITQFSKFHFPFSTPLLSLLIFLLEGENSPFSDQNFFPPKNPRFLTTKKLIYM